MDWLRNRSPWREVVAVILIGGGLLAFQLWAIWVTAPRYPVAPEPAAAPAQP